MASIIPGFEYDIFISYRQKDNKGEQWVSEFVETLRTELESTFKEEVSVYFDINPHDGLLETHDVDASLKEKLKCLIFIPVISRTYCDPNSFAWEHEFKAFIRQASGDQFGMKIKLPGGNVATRVLPVRIHDIESADVNLFESELGAVLRGIDFIYTSAGVNRPLRMREDNPKENLNRTYYRDQINKVANAIRDIIASIKSIQSGSESDADQHHSPERKQGGHYLRPVFRSKSLKRLMIYGSSIAAVLILILFLIIHGMKKDSKTIAFIPLRIFSDDISLLDDANNFVEVVNEKIKYITALSRVPTISMLPYRNTEKSLDEIRRDIGSNYYLDGNIRKEENKVIIWVELSMARANKMLWSDKFVWEKEKIPEITKEIAHSIAATLGIKLSAGEINLINSDITTSPDANVNYISANVISNDAWFYYNYGSQNDSANIISAINSYGKAIDYDPDFAQAYAMRSIASSWGYFIGQLDTSWIRKCKADADKALSLSNNLPDALIALGFYYYYCVEVPDEALVYFRRAAEQNPFNYQPLFYMSLVYRKMGDWKSVRNILSKITAFNPRESLFLTNIGLSYQYLHEFDSALIYHQKAIDLMPGWEAPYINKIQTLLLKDGRTQEAWKVIEEGTSKTANNMAEDRIMLHLYDNEYGEALMEAMKSNDSDFDRRSERYLALAAIYYCMKNPYARIYYDSAGIELQKEINEDPENFLLYAYSGIAAAGIGENNKAVENGEKAVQLASKDGMEVNDMRIHLAQIYTMAGDYGHAISTLEYLLSNPSMISSGMLMIDPAWEKLKETKEFREMLKKFE